MVAKRVIPCLDVREGRVVKGVQFQGLRDMGDPVELARRYDTEGADELVFLDISATVEGRSTRQAWVREVARQLSIPFTIGGGVGSVDDIRALLRCGADKVALNTALLRRPECANEAAAVFGCQCIVAAVDVARDPALSQNGESAWRVFAEAGRKPTGRSALPWLRELADRGAGEILLTSMDRDGTGEGFDLELLEACRDLPIPVIASGGAGEPRHFQEALEAGADAVLAASLFHEGRLGIPNLKAYLVGQGHSVRT